MMYPSPNATIRNILGGVIFREPILIANVPRLIATWNKPIVIARHAFGDQYKAIDFTVPGAGKLTMTFTPADAAQQPVERLLFNFPSAGVAMGMYNIDCSIRDFARAALHYGLVRKLPVYLSTKNTVLKAYDGRFKDIFADVYETEFRRHYELAGGGMGYEHKLIDDMVAWSMRSEGGFLWVRVCTCQGDGM